MHNAQTLDLQVSQWLPGNYSSHQAVQQETKFFFQFSCEKESPETHTSGGLRKPAETIRSTPEVGNRRVKNE